MAELLRIEKVAEMLDVSESTVRRLVKDGRLPEPRHIRSQARWFVHDVETYLRRLDRGEFEDTDAPKSCQEASGAVKRSDKPKAD